MLNKKNQKLEDENIELKRQLEKYQSAVIELELLNEIAITAGNATDIDQTLNNIIQKVLRAINAEQGSIMLLTNDQKDSFRTFLRQEDFSSLKPQYHVNTGISGWVLKNEEPLLIKDLSKENSFQTTQEERKDIHTVLCTPIWFEGKIMGLITMINKKDETEFSDEDLSLLSIISIQIGQLIKNSQLQQESFQKTKEAELSRWESERLQELDRIKTNFFTGISHEFRTPLALILGPLEILLNGDMKGDPSSQYKLMYNHAKRLLQLVNQLLELATIDAGKMKLEIGKYDVISSVKGITSSFQNFANEKNISLNFNSKLEKSEACFDLDKLEKILTNLISNSIKFTNENGFVNITTSEFIDKKYRFIEIEVEDNGPGMSGEVQSNIFNRFYKAQGFSSFEGTGIGLSLVKELVELHFGKITFNSVTGKGTSFKVVLPVDEEFYFEKKIVILENDLPEYKNRVPVANIKSEPVEEKLSEEVPLILIVEDNKDLRQFIKENVQTTFRVTESSDGEEALSNALENIPDLIISDVLMPKLNGFELCRKIKNNEKTSHIPIILLTSKAETDSRLEGLETGADDYLTKPFNNTELLVRINNLIQQRKNLRAKFRKEITLVPKDIAVTSTDEKFLNRVLQIVEQNLSNENFSAEDFAKSVGMSKTHLNRKLNALTEASANEFIRTYRLKKAVKLLAGKSGNISEVAYEVGFSNPSYFSESFKKLFGYSPSEFLQNPKAADNTPS